MDAGIPCREAHRVKRHSVSYLGNYLTSFLRVMGITIFTSFIVILQVYIFLPFIMYVMSHLSIKFHYVLLCSVGIQVACYYFYESYLIHYFPRGTRLMIWYLVFVLMGVWIGINYETYCKKDRYITAFVPIAIVSGISYTYLYHLSNISQHVPLGRLNLVVHIRFFMPLCFYIYLKSQQQVLWNSWTALLRYIPHASAVLFIMNRIYATANAILYEYSSFSSSIRCPT